MTTNLTTHETALDQALARFESERAKLFDSDGKPLWFDEHHQKRLTEFAAPVLAVAARAGEAATAAFAEADALEVAAPADPAAGLPTDELTRASAMTPFVQRDVDHLPLSDLAARVRAVAAGNDRPAKFAYLRFLPERIAQVEQAIRARTGSFTAGDATALRTLREAQEGLAREFADPSGKREQALVLRRAASSLQIDATTARMAADGTAREQQGAYRRQLVERW